MLSLFLSILNCDLIRYFQGTIKTENYVRICQGNFTESQF